ncbi:hypothetical protein OH76DRAFT_1482088 [Lentinus brumalis]|uniref:Uncharacterized protein n=1 Tax=Lentinus brumalis TaxID=2498619 RepID=A0A371DDQ4_9APHY|nr:hypothetical protein OH76DRAFT_1482088 [Polyporus brumalis]
MVSTSLPIKPTTPTRDAIAEQPQAYFFVFGGDHSEILQERPAGLALGSFKPILPIIIACATFKQAELVKQIHDRVFMSDRPRDAHAVAYFVQETGWDIKLKNIYAVKRAATDEGHTGIFLGFNWDIVEQHILEKKSAAAWRKRPTLREAIRYMLEKPGSNFPLIPELAEVPFPPSLRSPPPQPQQPRSQGTASVAPTPTRTRSQAPDAHRPAMSQVPVTPDQGVPIDDDVFYDAVAAIGIDDAQDSVDTADQELVISLLAAMVRPPATASTSTQQADRRVLRYPVTFGEAADTFLAQKGVTDAGLWHVLAARVHSRTVEAFTLHLGMTLNWVPLEASYLWRIMRFPSTQ